MTPQQPSQGGPEDDREPEPLQDEIAKEARSSSRGAALFEVRVRRLVLLLVVAIPLIGGSASSLRGADRAPGELPQTLKPPSPEGSGEGRFVLARCAVLRGQATSAGVERMQTDGAAGLRPGER